jgi:hypothetical protein
MRRNRHSAHHEAGLTGSVLAHASAAYRRFQDALGDLGACVIGVTFSDGR